MQEQEEEESSFIPSSTKEYWGFSLLFKCSDSSGERGRLESTCMRGSLWKHRGPKVSREVFTCVHRNMFVTYLPRYMKKYVHVFQTACEALGVWVPLCAGTHGKRRVKDPLALLQGVKSIKMPDSAAGCQMYQNAFRLKGSGLVRLYRSKQSTTNLVIYSKQK